MARVTMRMIMPVGVIVGSVIVRHSASMKFDGDLYSGRNFEYYYSVKVGIVGRISEA